ncbi:hypothetical protein GGX14DRAFT_587192 [Mycena pura]|uniref:Uncharacterized protein n=1 Tax=Mycena pura TaxID=153505 RepID=A0AAD6UWN9_9AGAR|nr:hypothetical protein GGX14DRAFT_587192 [Mycena pura]
MTGPFDLPQHAEVAAIEPRAGLFDGFSTFSTSLRECVRIGSRVLAHAELHCVAGAARALLRCCARLCVRALRISHYASLDISRVFYRQTLVFIFRRLSPRPALEWSAFDDASFLPAALARVLAAHRPAPAIVLTFDISGASTSFPFLGYPDVTLLCAPCTRSFDAFDGPFGRCLAARLPASRVFDARPWAQLLAYRDATPLRALHLERLPSVLRHAGCSCSGIMIHGASPTPVYLRLESHIIEPGNVLDAAQVLCLVVNDYITKEVLPMHFDMPWCMTELASIGTLLYLPRGHGASGCRVFDAKAGAYWRLPAPRSVYPAATARRDAVSSTRRQAHIGASLCLPHSHGASGCRVFDAKTDAHQRLALSTPRPRRVGMPCSFEHEDTCSSAYCVPHGDGALGCRALDAKAGAHWRLVLSTSWSRRVEIARFRHQGVPSVLPAHKPSLVVRYNGGFHRDHCFPFGACLLGARLGLMYPLRASRTRISRPFFTLCVPVSRDPLMHRAPHLVVRLHAPCARLAGLVPRAPASRGSPSALRDSFAHCSRSACPPCGILSRVAHPHLAVLLHALRARLAGSSRTSRTRISWSVFMLCVPTSRDSCLVQPHLAALLLPALRYSLAYRSRSACPPRGILSCIAHPRLAVLLHALR